MRKLIMIGGLSILIICSLIYTINTIQQTTIKKECKNADCSGKEMNGDDVFMHPLNKFISML